QIVNVTHDGAISLFGGGTLRGTGANAVENGTITVANANVTIGTGISGNDVLTLGNAPSDLTGGGSSNTMAVNGTGTVVLTQTSNLSNASKWSIGPGATLSSAIDLGFGAAPGAAVADYFKIDGGTLLVSAGITLNATRGVTLIGNSGNTFNFPANNVVYNGI